MMRFFTFSKGRLLREDDDVGFLRVALGESDVYIWVDVEAPTEEETQMLLEGVFNFHPLAIEDCVAVSERPKIDQYDTYLFMIVHAIDFSRQEHEFATTELNVFIGKNFLVTYHRGSVRSVQSTHERVRKNPTTVARAPDRLAYFVLDLLLDNYAPAIENLAGDIDDLEQEILSKPNAGTLNDIVSLKKQVQRLRQILSPQREVISRLAHGEYTPMRAALLPYYRDLLDRMARYNDLAESYRESLNSAVQALLNLQQARTNQVVKVLTILATLSLPLLAVTSFYGMNFRHMPELQWRFAYLWVLGVTLVFTGGVYFYLRRRNWL
jgi:magnesium transporter